MNRHLCIARCAQITFENLEVRRMLSSAIRSYDGTGNNLAHPDWGSTEEALIRLADAAYADGISLPSGATLPSARLISDTIVAHPADDLPNARHLSAFAYLWGQFIDHDLDLTNDAVPAEPFNIAVPADDPYFDPDKTGTQVISLNRSESVAGTGVTTAREQPNDITAYIDGSMVYGSSLARANALRSFVGGKLKTSAGNLLPFNTMGLDNATGGGPADAYFAAGDVRANENIELTALQTLFMREHNRLADQIAARNPRMNDEQVYQEARKLVIGEIQAITYNEYLPALLGANAISSYRGYNPRVNADVSNEFSTAAFRLGHSMLEDDVEFLNNDGTTASDQISLAQAFFNPAMVTSSSIDGMMKYLASTNSEEIDTKVVDSLRNFLFGQPGAGGFDLASLNIQRGRDHGLPGYNDVRSALGLSRATTFAQVTSDVELQQQLQSLYGTPDKMDLWVGGLAENHVRGSSLGSTFQKILVDQFTRVRDGDRFWYQHDLSSGELRMIQGVQLSDIIQHDSSINNLQSNVFFYNVEITGKVWNDRNGDGRQSFREQAMAGRVVTLLDETGAVIQTTTTDRDGSYSFSGIDLGKYTVSAQLSDGWIATTSATVDVNPTRSMRISNVNFGQRPAFANSSSANDSSDDAGFGSIGSTTIGIGTIGSPKIGSDVNGSDSGSDIDSLV